MDRFKIERYFTSIGRSFYSGDEYRDLEISYKPISNFGIGFLSAFMICREIDVKTRYYLDEEEGLKLHIPNFDGCFFIERDESLDIGTEITLYIDRTISHDIQADTIIDYIVNTMKDISYNICIDDQITNKKTLIESKSIRRDHHNDILFVPFLDSGRIVEDVSLEKCIRTREYINEYPYGLLIDVAGNNPSGAILNSGIKLYDTGVDDILNMLFRVDSRRLHFFSRFFLFNFPSNYLNIDVSREKVASLNEIVAPDFKLNLMSEIYKQIIEYINLCETSETGNAAINLHELMMTLAQLCKGDPELSNHYKNLMSLKYVLYIRFNEKTIDLIVSRSGKKPADTLSYLQSNYGKIDDYIDKFLSTNAIECDQESLHTQQMNKILTRLREVIDRRSIYLDKDPDGYFYFGDRFMLNDRSGYKVTEFLQKVLKSKDDSLPYAFVVLASLYLRKDGERRRVTVMDYVLPILLEQHTVSEVENGKCMVSIKAEDLIKVINRLKDKN